MIRQRDSLLEAIEAFRAVHPPISIVHILAFLYVCENEGLNVSELADLCQTTCATASRTAHALGRGQKTVTGAPVAPLVEIRPNPRNPKSRLIYLTRTGQDLREQLDALIASRVPIRLPIPRAA